MADWTSKQFDFESNWGLEHKTHLLNVSYIVPPQTNCIYRILSQSETTLQLIKIHPPKKFSFHTFAFRTIDLTRRKALVPIVHICIKPFNNALKSKFPHWNMLSCLEWVWIFVSVWWFKVTLLTPDWRKSPRMGLVKRLNCCSSEADQQTF